MIKPEHLAMSKLDIYYILALLSWSTFGYIFMFLLIKRPLERGCLLVFPCFQEAYATATALFSHLKS